MLKKLLLLALITAPFQLPAQCSSDAFMDQCATKLSTFTFVTSFNADSRPASAKNEFSYVFSMGSTYMIAACDQEIPNARMIVNLYDRNHKIIVSNYNKATKKFYPTITYPCAATGVYYIEMLFEKSADACGITILGLSKK